MTPIQQDLIWILDADPSSVSMYNQTLGLQYNIRSFDSLVGFTEALHQVGDLSPKLVLADPENIRGPLADFFKSTKETASGSVRRMPDCLVVSRIDDLELMRLYLRIGVRDYILKPLRPNELVSKVEKALLQISNREILILRNDLDGIQISDLTFREHQLLTIFLSRPNRSVLREELYGAIWNNVTVNRKTLDVHLFNLRRKIRPHGYDIVCIGSIFTLAKTSQEPPSQS